MCSLHMIFTMDSIWSLRNCVHNSMYVDIMVITNNIENVVKEYDLVIDILLMRRLRYLIELKNLNHDNPHL